MTATDAAAPPTPPTGPGAGTGRTLGRGPDGTLVVRSARFGVSATVPVRALVTTGLALATALLVFAWSLTVGDYPLPLADVVASLVGHGDASTDFVVRTLRLPRGLAGLLVGAALGVSGAIFQRIARNPLASPDIIGITAGAAACALLTIVALDGTPTQVTWGALAGSAATALAVYLLSYRRGVTGYRLVLVGIGVTAMLTSLTSYLMTRAEIYDAQRALVWLTGSLNGRGWDQIRPLGWALAVLLPAAALLGRHVRTRDLGDDSARGLGTRVEAVRTGLLLIGVSLAALAVSCAGPITFVALVAPQIARRLVGGTGAALLPSAGVGAALLCASDLVARRLFAPTELPAGIVTAVLGAPFLLWLLARANRIGSA
jgi:iron complex transport system permease protein